MYLLSRLVRFVAPVFIHRETLSGKASSTAACGMLTASSTPSKARADPTRPTTRAGPFNSTPLSALTDESTAAVPLVSSRRQKPTGSTDGGTAGAAVVNV